ncbi:MAG TPA: hypothetical protein VJN18_27385 [Polyangiaceae bacterium]|nr:hypothetical protein [Polyangiaceae bacterium]
MVRLVSLLIACGLLAGCFAPGEGVEVPQEEIYFPVGLSTDTDGSHLFVVSSDFDLKYNGGAVQSYALDELQVMLPQTCSIDQECTKDAAKPVCGHDGLCQSSSEDDARACPGIGAERQPHEKLLYPTRCAPIVQRPVSSAKIGAFATDAVLRRRPDEDQDGDGNSDYPAGDPERLFIPVRGDTTLHWFDVNQGTLQCGQSRNDGACDSAHRAGQNAAKENTRDLNLAAEPFAIDSNELGTTIVVTNQTTGTASLFVNDWSSSGPLLRFALASDRIPSRPVGIASLPQTDASRVSPTPDAFLMTFRNSAQVRLVRFADDGVSTPEREYLVDNGGVPIDANSVGDDSRGIALDSSERELALARCGEAEDGDTEADAGALKSCRDSASLVPIDVYVANRAPASLLIGRTRPPLEYPYFFQSLPLTVGPSRIVVGKVRTPSGELETRVFVVCFDSRRIFVYDPKRSRIEIEMLTGRGPHALAVDTERSLLYVAHFTDSFVGVFSLNLAAPASYGSMLGMLGKPKAPRAAK